MNQFKTCCQSNMEINALVQKDSLSEACEFDTSLLVIHVHEYKTSLPSDGITTVQIYVCIMKSCAML